MLEQIKRYFSLNVDLKPSEDHQQSIKIAAAALLFEVARSDFDMQEQEITHIQRVLGKALNLEESALLELMDLAMLESETSISLHGFTSLVNEHYSLSQKIELFKQLWSVAYADDTLDKYEESLLRKIADLIYLPHQHFIKTKQSVLALKNKG